MDKSKIIFFRNDDVGLFSNEPVSSELINMTNVFIEENIPVSHGVVPAEVNKDTIEWLKGIKAKHPTLIGIDQHGYKHVKHDRGEFGGKRNYFEQRSDIAIGMDLMNRHFGHDFSHCFNAPWVHYNRDTKRICDELGFKVFSGGVSPVFYARKFNYIGRLLNLNVMGKKEVSFHQANGFSQAGFNILEISASVDLIQDYRLKTLKTLDAVRTRFNNCKKHFRVIGFLLHQWVFDSKEKYDIVQKLLVELKKNSCLKFKLLEDI
jgi:hypothetical protein